MSFFRPSRPCFRCARGSGSGSFLSNMIYKTAGPWTFTNRDSCIFVRAFERLFPMIRPNEDQVIRIARNRPNPGRSRIKGRAWAAGREEGDIVGQVTRDRFQVVGEVRVVVRLSLVRSVERAVGAYEGHRQRCLPYPLVRSEQVSESRRARVFTGRVSAM